MSDFLKTTPDSYANEHFEEIADIQLDGEENTVGFIHRNRQGHGKIISAYHNGIEYVIQSQDNHNRTHENIIQTNWGILEYENIMSKRGLNS